MSPIFEYKFIFFREHMKILKGGALCEIKFFCIFFIASKIHLLF